MAKVLRVPAALLEAPGSIPSTLMKLTTAHNLVPGNLMPLLFLQTPGTDRTQAKQPCMHIHTHTYVHTRTSILLHTCIHTHIHTTHIHTTHPTYQKYKYSGWLHYHGFNSQIQLYIYAQITKES